LRTLNAERCIQKALLSGFIVLRSNFSLPRFSHECRREREKAGESPRPNESTFEISSVYSSIPAIVAVRKFASVPASIARRQSRATARRRHGLRCEPIQPCRTARTAPSASPRRCLLRDCQYRFSCGFLRPRVRPTLGSVAVALVGNTHLQQFRRTTRRHFREDGLLRRVGSEDLT